jgi:tetratricopeptide (TPR) repeat protein
MGVAEALHNLAITYRDQGNMAEALKTADLAVDKAQGSGNLRLTALARAGRAEIRLLAGDAMVARREIERVLETDRKIGNVIGEAQDLRVLAGCLAAAGNEAQAEAMLDEVIERAQELHRPHLAAEAQRDLARLLVGIGKSNEAHSMALRARARFKALGAEAEIKKLDDLYVVS